MWKQLGQVTEDHGSTYRGTSIKVIRRYCGVKVGVLVKDDDSATLSQSQREFGTSLGKME
jgi:hypothetical protein